MRRWRLWSSGFKKNSKEDWMKRLNDEVGEGGEGGSGVGV